MELESTMTLSLTSGLVINNPLALIKQFYEKDGHPLYDLLSVQHDNILDPVSLIAPAYFLTYTPPFAAWREVWSKRFELSAPLADIPPTLQLSETSIPWEALEQLFDGLLQVKGIKVTTASKILHKKRPHLIPLLDERIIDTYYSDRIAKYTAELNQFLEKQNKSGHFADRQIMEYGHGAVWAIKAIREDICKNEGCLKRIKAALGDDLDWTLVRIFDLILWQHAPRINPRFQSTR
jgi:hypothetical protein